MERTKARHLVTSHMNNLWPRWSLTFDLQESWVNVLLPFTEADTRAAIAQMKKLGTSGSRIEPIQEEFISYVKSVIGSKPKPVQPIVNISETANIWLMCTERGKNVAWPGHAVACKLGGGLGWAAREAAEWESLSCIGGKWEVFQGNRAEALARGREIKAGAVSVLDEPLLEQSVEDPENFNPNTLMPKEKDEIKF